MRASHAASMSVMRDLTRITWSLMSHDSQLVIQVPCLAQLCAVSIPQSNRTASDRERSLYRSCALLFDQPCLLNLPPPRVRQIGMHFAAALKTSAIQLIQYTRPKAIDVIRIDLILILSRQSPSCANCLIGGFFKIVTSCWSASSLLLVVTMCHIVRTLHFPYTPVSNSKSWKVQHEP